MKKISRILVLCVLSILVSSGELLAEERDRYGEVGGTFIRLVEREIGEREHMGIVIKPHDRDDHVTIFVPKQREELWQAARRLRAGQKVGVSYVTEAGQKWIKGLEAEWREVVEDGPESRRRVNVRREVFRYEDNQERHEPRRPERREPRRPEYLEWMQELKRILSSNLDRMAGEFRELRAYVQELERELQRLREENEQLRRELNERSGSKREHEREVRIRIQREGREREDRERPRERDESRARGERPRSEREVALHQLEVMRMALPALREAERGDAVELLTLAIRIREMMLEGRRDEEAQRVRERAPNRGQLVEILSLAAKLWQEFGHAEKSVAVRQLAEQFSVSRERQVSEQEQRVVRRRRVERREVALPEGMIGFRGVLVGRILRKLDRGFVLKVEEVTDVWDSNRADRPEAVVGKELMITIRTNEELSVRFLDTLRTLKPGERVLVEAFHFDGNRLTVVEQLKKVE